MPFLVLEALGYQPFDPWPLRDDHVPDHPLWHADRTTGESGSPQLLGQALYRNQQKMPIPGAEGEG